MTEQSGAAQSASGSETTAGLLDALIGFDGPPEQFLAGLLALQCRVGGAGAAAILRPSDEDVNVLAIFPTPAPGSAAPPWLSAAVEPAQAAAANGRTVVRALHSADDLYGSPPKNHMIVTPLRTSGPPAVAAFVITARDPAAVEACREQLELSSGLVSLYEMRQALRSRQGDFEQLRAALDILPSVNEHERFVAAAMALCNEAAARWQCERVSVGFLKGRYVQLKAMSHTEKFSRKMKLVQDIESAMEECFDQDIEVVCPADAEAVLVSRAAEELSKRHGPLAIVSLPMRKGGEVVGVVTLERAVDQPFTLSEIESMRLTCDLVTPRLINMFEHDKWLGARAAGSARKGLAALIGPKHTWKKVVVVLILAALAFLTFAKGPYTAEAPFILETTKLQIVAAPFDGEIEEVFVEPPDDVIGTELGATSRNPKAKRVLAKMDTRELDIRLIAAEAELNKYETRRNIAMSENKLAEAQIERARIRSGAAQIDLLKYQIERGTITSSISGRVIAGDLKPQRGVAVKTGDVLFEVAPIELLRAELDVPEALISDIRVGQPGQLATEDHADTRIDFVVERINPIAQVVDQRNVFKVRVKLIYKKPDEKPKWLMPKLEGVAKIHIGRRRYAWIWTRRLSNWLRMKLWI